jgi:phosphohistidine phosphatase
MLRLLLLRHAKASSGESGQADFDRHVIPRGRRAAASIGEYMAKKTLTPDAILCSSSRRTRDTLAALLPFIKDETDIHLTDELYESTLDSYLATIRAHGGAAAALLVIGHNPAIEETAAELLARNDSGSTPAIHFPTSALAVIDFDISDWRDLKAATGRLVVFVEPKALALGVKASESLDG